MTAEGWVAVVALVVSIVSLLWKDRLRVAADVRLRLSERMLEATSESTRLMEEMIRLTFHSSQIERAFNPEDWIAFTDGLLGGVADLRAARVMVPPELEGLHVQVCDAAFEYWNALQARDVAGCDVVSQRADRLAELEKLIEQWRTQASKWKGKVLG